MRQLHTFDEVFDSQRLFRGLLDSMANPGRRCRIDMESKKMFGEYGLYCDGVFFAVLCDDQLFVKITPQGEAAFPDLPKAPPYPGARDSFLVEDVDDRERLTALVQITCDGLRQQPTKKRRK